MTKDGARKAETVGLLVIVLLAFALRVYRLDAQSLWYDEAVTAQVVTRGLLELTRWTADDIQPPLYYYLVLGWNWLAGRSEWALRFPSVFCGVLTVPLCWALARRLFGSGQSGKIAGLVAALLGALSPLYVYYAQEARMYTLLTFLGVLAGYALLRAMTSEGRSRLYWWVACVLASVAMLYTHYFGAFLLLALACCFGLAWIPRAARMQTRPSAWRDLRWALAAFAAIIAFYLPWLPALLTRYQVDRSYWQGSLKLGEALRHVAISFTAGAPDTMLEGDAMRLLPWFGIAFGIALLALWLARQGDAGRDPTGGRAKWETGSPASLLYLLLALFVPIVAVLVLASRTPKFNARYLMLASPAYLLILAGGIAALVDRRASSHALGLPGAEPSGAPTPALAPERSTGASERAPRRVIPAVRNTLGLAMMAFLVIGSVVALRNWFADPAFTKAQWRELVAYVRSGMEPGEAVLLVSGHAWPAWAYYAPDIPAVRLPDIDVLDVNAVLDLKAGQTLAQALQGKPGAWLVQWQSEAVDPVGVVPHLLDQAGSERLVPREFWHLGLRRWALRSDATYPAYPQPKHADGANYGHRVALLGWDDPEDGRITLYWKALNPIDGDYQVSLVLEDAAGSELGRWDGRPAGYDYPTFRWRPGELLFGQYTLPVPSDAPADDYYLTIALYDQRDPSGLDIMDVADNPAGKRVRIGPIRVER